jgi:hypothetical protein
VDKAGADILRKTAGKMNVDPTQLMLADGHLRARSETRVYSRSTT